MLWSLDDLRGYRLRATDDVLGDVRDILFDDGTWHLRYLVVDTGSWLFGRRVLIAASALSTPDTVAGEIPVALTRDQIKNSPDVDADRPVSRQQEATLHGYYGWAPYWTAPAAPGGMPMGALGLNPPALGDTITPPPADAPADTGPDRDRADGGNAYLRSFREVSDYTIAATDGEIGRLQDLLIGQDWRIRYLVVDTGNWLPDKRVILSPDWVREIDWDNRRIVVNQTTEKVRSSPEYRPQQMVDRSYESRIYTHYGEQPYW